MSHAVENPAGNMSSRRPLAKNMSQAHKRMRIPTVTHPLWRIGTRHTNKGLQHPITATKTMRLLGQRGMALRTNMSHIVMPSDATRVMIVAPRSPGEIEDVCMGRASNAPVSKERGDLELVYITPAKAARENIERCKVYSYRPYKLD